jgi:hypothetical protein
MQFTRSFRALLATATCGVFVALSGCGGGGGGGNNNASAPETPAPPKGRLVSATINSAKTNFAYPITIYLPASYDTVNVSYPTIYALDADARFVPPDTRFTNLKNILELRGTNAILVGIGGTQRRGIDFDWPGALAYHDFITLELIPFIESQFRSEPKMRMLSGLSKGGSFVGLALFMEAPNTLFFSSFLSAEGDFNFQSDIVHIREEEMFQRVAGQSVPVTVILARSTGTCCSQSVHDMYVLLGSRHYVGIQLTETVFPFGHAEMDFPSFEDALAKILG